ncbi:MAG: MFS transporter [Planctomycetales bacterium]|nr:MFS transporter [Planctomycetales bacterium]
MAGSFIESSQAPSAQADAKRTSFTFPSGATLVSPSGKREAFSDALVIALPSAGDSESSGWQATAKGYELSTAGTIIRSAKEVGVLRDKGGAYATSWFLAGWACGGLFFGVLGDRIGRVKSMLITILLYSACTGLSALSQGVTDFCFYRFLTGLGVGGEFAVGVALVAEVMPARARPYALAALQAFSAVGNISAALINWGLSSMGNIGGTSPWRMMFVVGAAPALLALVIRARLKESEQWQRTSHEGAMAKKLGSYAQLFQHPTWRKHAIFGLILACSGVIGLWAVGFFAPDLIRKVQRENVVATVCQEEAAIAEQAGDAARADNLNAIRNDALAPANQKPGLNDEQLVIKNELEESFNKKLSAWSSITSILINIGAACGMFGFGVLSQRIGRRPTFALGLLAAFLSTSAVFWLLQDMNQMWLVPIMGFCQLSLFAGYAMYFPELFPTHLRATGTSFCYNVGRFAAAAGPLIQSQLVGFFSSLYAGSGGEPLRYAGVTMSLVYLIGLFVLPLLPETFRKPLPE